MRHIGASKPVIRYQTLTLVMFLMPLLLAACFLPVPQIPSSSGESQEPEVVPQSTAAELDQETTVSGDSGLATRIAIAESVAQQALSPQA